MIRLLALLVAACVPAAAAERWQRLPPTPAPAAADRSGNLPVNGVSIHYAMLGHGAPVILLHGGLANSNYWGMQVPVLAAHHTVVLMDSRGHGRSTRDARSFGYDLMADDVVGLLDALGIGRADVVGWSDGGIIGLDLALRHPDRVGRVFAFAANATTAGVKSGVDHMPAFSAYIARAGHEYAALSPTPGRYDAFVHGMSAMWAREPNWSAARLRMIHTPVMIVDGDHDEAIRLDHTRWMAATIPAARLAILPGTSHFAFLQDPAAFNAAMMAFLGD